MTPIEKYRLLLSEGEITPDAIQALAVEKLSSLHHALKGYTPSKGAAGWLERFGLTRRPKMAPPKGLYLYGSVGRGKSMLMDLFYECLETPFKKRIHFHEFMNDVHDRLHLWRKNPKNASKTDPLPDIAKDLASEEHILCFDEFHVTDITDAMILSKLFTNLFDQGVIVVATSNWAPNLLYKDGLQRELFLPFIDLLQEKLDILELSGPTDYRLTGLIEEQSFFIESTLAQATEKLSSLYKKAIEPEHATPYLLEVLGRKIDFKSHSRNILWADFSEICQRPLGARDYIEIAHKFDLIFLANVPILQENQRNELKRLILFIDALYEGHCDIAASLEAPIEGLYQGQTHKFELDRTISRLTEMQSSAYREEEKAS